MTKKIYKKPESRLIPLYPKTQLMGLSDDPQNQNKEPDPEEYDDWMG